METFLALFVNHDTYVVSFLVVGITIVVVLLLLFTQKSPDSVVKAELGGGSDNVEGALRRVLGEQRWLQAGANTEAGGGDPQVVSELEKEVLEKDRKIAELNKQLTQSDSREGGGGGAVGDNSDLMNKISELEARLQEYEIIEDDIADLSLYKTENEKLKEELLRLKSLAGGEDPTLEVVDEVEESSSEESLPADGGAVIVQEEDEQDRGVDGADLVAEFEKVVNSQIDISNDEPSSRVSVKNDIEPGKVVMAGDLSTDPKTIVTTPEEIHPKLRNINPDSKEEAEVFISELKSLKKAKKEG